MTIHNQVQLITYPDSLGGTLKSLENILTTHFRDAIGGVHILPPFPSSADRGFAPQTYFAIDPAFGDWADIRSIGANFDVLVDVMVNHISRQSMYFQDFQQHGRQSPYADMFLTLDKVWPDGQPRSDDVAKIFLRRPDNPFLDVTIADTGAVERIWASFGTREWSEQIDIDVNSPAARKLFREILAHMQKQRVNIIRLDAIAYVTKKAGTNCFFVEPEIFAFLDWINAEAAAAGIELLPELHAPLDVQMKLAAHGEWVYNFVLPGLILHALQTGQSEILRDHLTRCPQKQITMLDCHDGIPVQPDLDGILDIDEAQRMVRMCIERGANLNRILSESHKLRPDFDAHQINITYYSALDRNDDAYLTARAIQFFAPGIPQVYYVGLLAGENDQEEVERTGERRAINRHNYTQAEVETALQNPAVQRLHQLMRFRSQHPAFAGTFQVADASPGTLRLIWENDGASAQLTADVQTGTCSIIHQVAGEQPQVYQP